MVKHYWSHPTRFGTEETVQRNGFNFKGYSKDHFDWHSRGDSVNLSRGRDGQQSFRMVKHSFEALSFIGMWNRYGGEIKIKLVLIIVRSSNFFTHKTNNWMMQVQGYRGCEFCKWSGICHLDHAVIWLTWMPKDTTDTKLAILPNLSYGVHENTSLLCCQFLAQ